MNTIEYAALIVIVGVIAALLAVIFESKEPAQLRAEDLGYMPGSETRLGLASSDCAWADRCGPAFIWANDGRKVADMRRPEEYFLPGAPEPVIRGGAGRVVAIKQSGEEDDRENLRGFREGASRDREGRQRKEQPSLSQQVR